MMIHKLLPGWQHSSVALTTLPHPLYLTYSSKVDSFLTLIPSENLLCPLQASLIHYRVFLI